MMLLVPLSLLLGAPAFLAADAPDAHRGQFVVQTTNVLPVGDRLLASGHTGVAAIDQLNARFGVVAIHRLYPLGAGRGDPAAFAELGMDRTWIFEFDGEREDVAAVAADYAALEEVAYAEPDDLYTYSKVPNDPRWNDQWSMRKIGAPQAWNLITDTTGTPVAGIDTGVDQNHSDIMTNRWKNQGEVANNNIDDDGNGYVDDVRGYDFANNDGNPDDDNGHGTHTAGTFGAIGDNGLLVAGVCWIAEVMSLKALNSGGSGYLSDVAEAVTYATDNGARVINMSIGGPDDNTLRNAVAYAGRKDVVQVAAAGNDGGTGRVYPAAYPEVMGIISTDANDRRSGFSTHGNWCSMAAPGEGIISLWNNGSVAFLDGTSMSSPHVAGVATLVRSIHAELDRQQVQQVLEQSSVDLGAPGFDSDFGFGRLDAERAVKMANALRSSKDRVLDGESVDFTLDYKDAANQTYLLLPGRNGHDPGIDLSVVDPAEHRFLPVNEDAFVQNFLLTHPFNGVFYQFIGSLDAQGKGTATLNVPRHFWIDEDFHFAFLTFDPADLSTVQWISTSVEVKVRD